MTKERGSSTPKRSILLIGVIFIFISVIITRVIPDTRFEPDMALILTIYCALTLPGSGGVLLPIFAGAYVGTFSAFPIEFMILYPALYYGIRFVTSFFQLRFVGYPMFLAFSLEFLVGAIYALGIYLKQPEVFSMEIAFRIIGTQAILTSLFLPLVFFIFEWVTHGHTFLVQRALK